MAPAWVQAQLGHESIGIESASMRNHDTFSDSHTREFRLQMGVSRRYEETLARWAEKAN